ncbi:hypothetical protein N7478_006660 [Penicillium angulare]|uniref:uncharacterized protein n=1 Tax=Penicillium angulare TaxID=116970 RepID=UPI002540E1C2|nr:uncharacterized protein N7478_006660 [Penicillium angulare]KAJ5281288.1 hypothetical protein N7478_006660 [Penicillium angulare]
MTFFACSVSMISRRHRLLQQADTNGLSFRRVTRPAVPDSIPVLNHHNEQREVEDLRRFQNNFLSNGLPEAISHKDSGSKLHGRKDSTWTYAKTPSIAAATILGTITFLALVFLIVWYIRRERTRRLRYMRNESQDPFYTSNLTLTEDTSKTLHDFLMKDVQPERTSLMFSRSRSPSFTFVINKADRQKSTNRLYRGSYDASSNSLSKLTSLTRVSTEASRPSLMISGLTQTTSNSSTQLPASSSRLSMVSTVPPTARSSMLWTTTTSSTNSTIGTSATEPSSIFSQLPTSSSRTSQSVPPSLNNPRSSVNSIVRSNPSDASRTSSRHSVTSARNSIPIAMEQNVASRRAQVKSHRRSPSSVQSPIELSGVSGQSSQLPSIPSTPSGSFRLSDA